MEETLPCYPDFYLKFNTSDMGLVFVRDYIMKVYGVFSGKILSLVLTL